MGVIDQLANWVRGRKETPPDDVVDAAEIEGAEPSAPFPSQAALDALIDQVRAVRVLKSRLEGKMYLRDIVLLETSEPAEMAALRRTMRIFDGDGQRCMCMGEPALELLSADRSRLALFTLHHGLTFRWDLWEGDARLIDGRMLLEWLAERGVPEPLQDFEANMASGRQRDRNRERWLAAMPSAIQPVWSDSLGLFETDVIPLRTALQGSLPDEGTRVLALLEWFGSGAGPWSGFPTYEMAAEKLLLGYSTASLVKAIESTQLSPAQRTGAARLFAGWSFNKQRPNGLREIPKTLRKCLWNHVMDTQDDDIRGRAKRAFAD